MFGLQLDAIFFCSFFASREQRRVEHSFHLFLPLKPLKFGSQIAMMQQTLLKLLLIAMYERPYSLQTKQVTSKNLSIAFWKIVYRL